MKTVTAVFASIFLLQASDAESSEIDDLHREVVAIEIFVADYESVFRSELSEAVDQRIEIALVAAGPSIESNRASLIRR